MLKSMTSPLCPGRPCPGRGPLRGLALGLASAMALLGAACASGTPGDTALCGNGLLEQGEACDDGNPDPGDGCSAACTTEPGFQCDDAAPSVCGPICGDDQVVGGEACDGADLGGRTCESLNLGAGTLACDADCQLEPAGCSAYSCGNGVRDGAEACDGADFGEDSCLDHGYDGGGLACTQACAVDTSGCTLASCGNGIVEGVETCDDGGTAAGDGCGPNCSVEPGWDCVGEPSSCTALCGNGILDAGEQCDGVLLGGQTCASLGLNYVGGTLACGTTCQFDTSQCDLPSCGNGALDSGEQCDGVLLDGATCQSLGFLAGSLLCTASCGYNVGGCVPHTCGDSVVSGTEACDDGNTAGGDGCNVLCNVEAGWECTGEPSTCTRLCGNGALNAGEQCDGALLGSQTCITQGFDAGTLACGGTCQLDTSECRMATCGDGHRDSGEDCDGADLGTATCLSLGFVSGMLQCTVNCGYNTAACVAPVCGDGVISPSANEQCDDNNSASGDGCNTACQVESGWICSGSPSVCTPSCPNGVWNPGEQCDGADLHGGTCQSQGFAGGTLACTGSCTYDTSQCQAAICGNGTRETGEACDTSDFGGQTCASFGFVAGNLSCDGSCQISTANCVNCAPSGCATDSGPDGKTCGNAKTIGRTAALAGAHYSGDTSGDGNNDDLSTNATACWDAKYDNFYRIYLLSGDRINVTLDPIDYDFDAMLKLYSGTDCAGGANGDADLISCYNGASDGGTETFSHTATADGWFTIVVDGRMAFSSDYDYGAYTLDVTLTCTHSNCCCG